MVFMCPKGLQSGMPKRNETKGLVDKDYVICILPNIDIQYSFLLSAINLCTCKNVNLKNNYIFQ